MKTLELSGVGIGGIAACLPPESVDNLARCTELYGSASKALSVVRATGIAHRRVVAPGVTSLDLCVAAAQRLLANTHTAPDAIAAVVCVTFTPARLMPCNAAQAQSRLGLARDTLAFDIGLACSGYPYGLYVSGLLARATGRAVLLLDGDAQTPRTDPSDAATVPVLADAGTATLVVPRPDAADAPWRFAFLTDGAKGDALQLPFGGTLSMDGFAVFRFVTMDALAFIRDFLAATDTRPDALDAFAPHQANVFMIRQVAKRLGVPDARLWVSGDVYGNSASATIPVTLAHCGRTALPNLGRDAARILLAGFGGGLSASAALVTLRRDAPLAVVS